jgi:hypothetical protein
MAQKLLNVIQGLPEGYFNAVFTMRQWVPETQIHELLTYLKAKDIDALKAVLNEIARFNPPALETKQLLDFIVRDIKAPQRY